MSSLNDFKVNTNKYRNKNFIFVHIKADRRCMNCSNTIVRGTECLTVNPKGKGRRWFCDDCVQLMLNVSEAQAIYDNTAFGDEGGACANLEALEEAKVMFYEAKFG